MNTHYHRCGECGMVWGHPDSMQCLALGDEADKAEFRKAHTCPRGCPGRWTEHYEPKKITREQLRCLGACRSGVNHFFETVGAEDKVHVSFELIELIPDDCLHEMESWTYDLLYGGPHIDEFNAKLRDTPHTFQSRCAGCVNRLMLFVELYNRG